MFVIVWVGVLISPLYPSIAALDGWSQNIIIYYYGNIIFLLKSCPIPLSMLCHLISYHLMCRVLNLTSHTPCKYFYAEYLEALQFMITY